MAECTGSVDKIIPPEPKSRKEQLLEILGMQEIVTTMTVDDETVTVVTIGTIVE